MIFGGNSAGGKLSSQRLNYSHVYLPLQTFTFSKSVISEITSSSKARKYNAYVTIETDSGTVDLVTCSYFQVQRKSIGSNDSASLTIQKAQVWSVWGTENPGILSPSQKVLTIYCGIPGEEIPIYFGRITSSIESQGANGGAININCSDFRVTMKREDACVKTTEHTKYFEMHRQANQAFRDSGQVLCYSDQDGVGIFNSIGNKYDASNKAISGEHTWQASPAGCITSGANNNNLVLGDDIPLLDDRVIYTATRSISDSSSFNTVSCVGLDVVGGTLISSSVNDAADVAKRGRITYSTTIGTDKDLLTDVESIAATMIASVLEGGLAASVVFNPYLCSGMIMNFQSDRFNISPTIASLGGVRHQYSYGDAQTFLDGVDVW